MYTVLTSITREKAIFCKEYVHRLQSMSESNTSEQSRILDTYKGPKSLGSDMFKGSKGL